MIFFVKKEKNLKLKEVYCFFYKYFQIMLYWYIKMKKSYSDVHLELAMFMKAFSLFSLIFQQNPFKFGHYIT